jgi:hypothetical protein
MNETNTTAIGETPVITNEVNLIAPVVSEIDLLENHIDEPIKKCVVGMALLGFKPLMSCCGFNYPQEKVPKKHLNKVYMYLSLDDIQKNSRGTNLLQIMQLSNWKIDILSGAHFIDFYANTWDKNHPWNDEKCPHFCEVFVLAINALERTLANLKPYFQKEAKIEDGNKFYIENVSKFWQYKPCKEWVVTPEIFDKL